MTVDLNFYKTVYQLFKDFESRNKTVDNQELVNRSTQLFATPVIVILHFLKIIRGSTPELETSIRRTMAFYQITQVVPFKDL